MNSMTPTAETLALKFSQGLRLCLSAEEMAEVVRLNLDEDSLGICHSHDFCDANMVLYEVFMQYGMNPVGEDGLERWGDLWDRTWNMAKAAGFNTN
jgi:hypothetical protein